MSTDNGRAPANTIDLADATNRRLATLLAGAQAAEAVAQAAKAQADQWSVRYRDALIGILEVQGVPLGGDVRVDYRPDLGKILIDPPMPLQASPVHSPVQPLVPGT